MLPPRNGLLMPGSLGTRMAVDKRFWTGALAVATVVIAGASALPSLLLAPSGGDPVPLVAAAAAPKPADAKPLPFRNVAPETPVAPTPVHAEPAAPPAPAAAAVAAPEPSPPAAAPIAAAPPAPAAVAPPAPATPAPVAPAASFPPVQPVGVAAAATENVPAPATQSRAVSAEQRTRGVRVREARAAQTRKRGARPARYPIREFLAWRR